MNWFLTGLVIVTIFLISILFTFWMISMITQIITGAYYDTKFEKMSKWGIIEEREGK